MTLKKECATCQLPIKLVTFDGFRWQWVHDVTLGAVLRQAVRLSVPPRHSLMRETPILKEASFGENRDERDGDTAA